MVRRRSASPKASAPVRRAPSPSHAPAPMARGAAPPPPPGTTPGMPGAPSRGPGLMGQMAATAGGVAIGSAVGHAVGNMMTGGGGKEQVAAEYAPEAQQAAGQQGYSQPCEFEWRQFMDCTQNQSDLSVCQSFNDMFKQCKARYPPQQ
jgi:hypothetical protein